MGLTNVGGGGTDIGIRVVVFGAATASRQLGAIRGDMTRFAQDITRSASAAEKFGASVVRMGDALSSLGRLATITLTFPIIGMFGSLTSAGIKFQDTFADVTKTAEGTSIGFKELANEMGKTVGQLTEADKTAILANPKFGQLTKIGKDLEDQFRKLALTIPISVFELNQLGGIAGQLGVPTDQIKDFVDTVGKLGVTTNMTSEEAANALAKFGNILGISHDQIGEFAKRAGAALVHLGNISAASESQIADMAMRLAGAGRVVGLTAQEILALSTSLAEMGVRAELGGTAVSRVLLEVVYAAADGGDALQAFADIVGMTGEEFTQLFKRDANEALLIFIQRLAEMQDQGKVTSDQLAAMGLSGVRVRDVLNRLGPNVLNVRNNVAEANKAWAEGIALEEEFAKRSKTVAAQIQLLKNHFADLGITVFKLVEPQIAGFIKHINDLIAKFEKLDPGMQKLIINAGLIAAALGPGLLIVGTLTQLFGNAFIGVGRLTGGIKKLLTLPFYPLASLFGGLFGKKSLINGLAVGPRTGGLLKNITNIFSSGGFVGKLIGGLTGGIGKGFSLALSAPNLVTKVTGSFIDFLYKVATTLINVIPGGRFITLITDVISLPFRGIEKIAGPVSGLLKGLSIGVTSVLGKLPGFGFSLVKNLLGPLKYIPQLALLAGGALTLLFAPKVISQVIKNRDKFFKEIKTSFSQFGEDLKKVGLEKSILLFLSGGTTGSGREGGLRGIALALGASEEHANKFAYAMGVAGFWVLKIAETTKILVQRIFQVLTGTEDVDRSVSSTSDKLISLGTNIAKFFEGFFKGWVSTFDDIVTAFGVLRDELGDFFDALSGLFDAIFGKKGGVTDFKKTLEPGTKDAATSIGETVGQVIGEIITLATQGLAAITLLATSVTEALTAIVTTYKEGGVKGALEELGQQVGTAIDNLLFGKDAKVVNKMRTGIRIFAPNMTGILADLWFDDATWKDRLSELQDRAAKGAFGEGDLIAQPLSEQTQQNIPGTTGLVDRVSKAFDDLKTWLSSDEVKEKLTTGFNQAFSVLKDAGKWLWEGKGEFVGLKQILTDLAGTIGTWVKGPGWELFKSIGEDIVSAISKGIEEEANKQPLLDPFITTDKEWNQFVSDVQNSAPGDPGNFIAQGLIGDYATDATDILTTQSNILRTNVTKDDFINGSMLGRAMGENVSTGYMDGLNTKQPEVVTAFQTHAQAWIDAARAKLEIFSPSGVFYRIGTDTLQGLINGIYGQTTPLQTAINSVIGQFTTFSNGIVASLMPAQAALTGLMNLSMTVGSVVTNALNNAFGVMGMPGQGTTNNLTYNPSFYGPQPPATYQQNNNLYSQWLTANQAVG